LVFGPACRSDVHRNSNVSIYVGMWVLSQFDPGFTTNDILLSPAITRFQVTLTVLTTARSIWLFSSSTYKWPSRTLDTLLYWTAAM